MIIFERTEEDIYDGIRLEITGGYENNINDYIHYFITFLEALTFERETIIEGLREFVR